MCYWFRLRIDEVSLAPHFSEVVVRQSFRQVTVSTVSLGKPLKRLIVYRVDCVHLTKVKVLLRCPNRTNANCLVKLLAPNGTREISIRLV